MQKTSKEWIAILAGIAAALVLTIAALFIISAVRKNRPAQEPARETSEEPTRRSKESATEAPTTQASTTVPTTTRIAPAEPATTEPPFINVLPSGDYNLYYLKEVDDAKGGWYCTFRAFSLYTFTDNEVNVLRTGDTISFGGFGDYCVQRKEQDRITLIRDGASVSDLYLQKNARGVWLAISIYDGEPLDYSIGEFELFATSDTAFVNDTVQTDAKVSSPHELWYYSEYTGQYDIGSPVQVEIRIENGNVTLLKSLFHP